MPFSSLDQLLEKITSGNSQRVDFQKNLHGAGSVGFAYFPASAPGIPGAATIYQAGTNLAFQPVSGLTADSGAIQHQTVSPSNKHLVGASITSTTTNGGPSIAILVDLVGFIRFTTMTLTTLQSIDNTLSPSRYTDGKGLRMFLWNDKAAALSTAANFTITYTNQDNVTGRTATAQTNSSAPQGMIVHSGSASVKPTPFLNLQGNDSGVKKIDSIQLASSYGPNEMCIGLCRPIITMPITQQSILTERDFITSMPSLPKIEDSANLQWILMPGVAQTSFTMMGHLDFAWD